jgi:hypothetical protein
MQKTDTSSINNSRFETPVSSKINLSNQYSSEDDVIEDNHVVHAVVSFLDDYFERPKIFVHGPTYINCTSKVLAKIKS